MMQWWILFAIGGTMLLRIIGMLMGNTPPPPTDGEPSMEMWRWNQSRAFLAVEPNAATTTFLLMLTTVFKMPGAHGPAPKKKICVCSATYAWKLWGRPLLIQNCMHGLTPPLPPLQMISTI